ncbi:MAG TPA: HD domain-containing protein, partial [Promineifilum sp.]|nr:HD domain-containing protein [Promineifilum sp.]
SELPAHLTYHSLHHTRDDVLPACLRLADVSGIPEADVLCLATAAAYHDIGFLYSYAEHEAHGIALARAVLPGFGYSDSQIDTISALIAATRMPQTPTTPLAQLLCDADLDVLGRDDFWDLNRKLLAETARYGRNGTVSEEEWLGEQMRFLQRHVYFSTAARRLRDDGKARNMARMQRAIAAGDSEESRHAH